jgi:hypothetical protein
MKMARRQLKSFAIFDTVKEIGAIRIGVFGILGIVGAWFAFALAVSGVARIRAPAAALAVMPDESVALASRADQLFFANPQNPPPEVKRLALKALESQPINPKALRLLGYIEDVGGNSGKAETYIRMAAKLSRREPGAQLWLIEAAARKGDIRQTLVHYDIALRTKPDTQTVLFSRLVSAIEDPEIRSALKPYIRNENGWGPSFLSFAVNNSKDLPVLTSLILETGGLSDPEESRVQEVALIGRLVSERYFSQARLIFLQMPGAQPSRVSSVAFDASDRDAQFGAMGWQLISDPDAGGGFAGDGKRTALSVFANSATTRPVATKLLYLKPSNYIFDVKVSNIDRGSGGFLRWELRCQDDVGGKILWSVDSVTTSLKARFKIPAGCPVQYLYLIASGGNGQTGLEATIGSVFISPEG